ncbi:MAG: hypothetical protein OEZ02_08110, partial [Anaerolineae bacterium]|nr:hypothetical protein [Anaerolineae bacterium]
STRAAVPTGIEEYFLPNNLTLAEAAKAAGEELPASSKTQGMIYRPRLLAQADVRFLQRKYNLDHEMKQTALVDEPDRRGVARWEDYLSEPVEARGLDRSPAPDAQFATLEAPLSDGKALASLEKDFIDWVYRTVEVQVLANETLKTYAGPPTTEGEFRKQSSEAAREQRDAEIKNLKAKYKTKLESVQKKLSREKRELAEDEAEHSQRKMEEMGTHLENVIGLLGGSKRRVSSSLTKRRMTSQAKADVEESIEAIQELEHEMVELGEEIEAEIDEIEDRWGEIANEITEIPVNPLKKDVLIELFGVAWLPYYLVKTGSKTIELPGYDAG